MTTEQANMLKELHDKICSPTIFLNIGNTSTIDLNSIISINNLNINIADLTIDNFIVSFISAPGTNPMYMASPTNRQDFFQGRASGCSLSKSYNKTTGILNISGMSQTIQTVEINDKQPTQSLAQTFSFYVYLIVN